MSLIVACVRNTFNQNNNAGWRCEVIRDFKVSPKSYTVEFEGHKFRLERASRNGTIMDQWNRYPSYGGNYSFNLCETAKTLWLHVRGMVTHGNKQAEKIRKWLRDEEQKVKDLKEEIRLLRIGDGAWHSMEEKENDRRK